MGPALARARVDELFASCRDARTRARLIRIDRLLRLQASPLRLADAVPPDLQGIAAARSPDAIEEHARLLTDQSRPWPVREAASRALAHTRTPRARSLLLRAAEDSDPGARRLAATALGEQAAGSTAVRSSLERLLADRAPGVRAAAARALRLAPRSAALLLGRLDLDRDESVRLACLEALACAGRAGDLPRLVPLTRAGGRLGEAAARCVRRISRRERLPEPDGLPPPPARRDRRERGGRAGRPRDDHRAGVLAGVR